MTPEEAEAFRAALENLLREHRVYLSATTDQTISVSRATPQAGRVLAVQMVRMSVFLDIECDYVPLESLSPHRSQAPPLHTCNSGRISPDTPW